MQPLQEIAQREHIYLSPSPHSPAARWQHLTKLWYTSLDIDTVKVQNIPNPQAALLLQFLWPYPLCPPPPTLL